MRNNLDFDSGFTPYTYENPAPFSVQGYPTYGGDMYGYFGDERQKTIQNELANKPRYDIDNRRYGNTIQDDMFAMKNPNYVGHTPESYRYLVEKTPMTFDREEIPVLKKATLPGEAKLNDLVDRVNYEPDFRDRAISRKKNITGDSNDWYTADGLMDIAEEGDADSYILNEYLKQRAANEQKRITDDLSTRPKRENLTNDIYDDMFAIKNGSAHYAGYQAPRWDAEPDYSLNNYPSLVNYYALSPATLEQLAKMGVNRPTRSDNWDVNETYTQDANDDLMGLINAYKWAMENGYR